MSSHPTPPTDPNLIAATVIGFSRNNCKKCNGTGRAGYDVKYRDNAHVIPCSCLEFMDLEAVRKSWAMSQQAREEVEPLLVEK